MNDCNWPISLKNPFFAHGCARVWAAIDALSALSDRAASGHRPAMRIKRPLPPSRPALASTASPFASDSAQLRPTRTRHEHLMDLAVGDDRA